jgi:ADP-heptose:LPS heptosyltransferase
MAHVIKNAMCFVGIDSFPMHVAQTFDVPGVCFFGSIDPKTRIIKPNMKGVTAKNLKCLGCHHRSPPCTSTITCENGIMECINMVTVEEMMEMVDKIIT